MKEKVRLQFDKVASTYAWRFCILPEFDTRKVKEGPNIISGFSKFENQPEIQNKKHLLINCMSSLFSNGWIEKSNGIDVYIREDYWKKDCVGNKRILCIRLKNGLYQLCHYHAPISGYDLLIIEPMIKNINFGKIEVLKIVPK